MRGKNETIGGGGLHHVAIRAFDFDATVQFYSQGLGFTEKIRWGEGDRRAVLLDTGEGDYLEVFAGGKDEPKPEGAILHFALRTTDCDTAIERARAAGAVVTMEPRDITIASTPPAKIRIAFCKGPDGEVIEFFQECGWT
jgi:glyoxylase I family protein